MSVVPNPSPSNPSPPQNEKAAGQPSSVTALDLAKRLKGQFDAVISEPTEFRGELTLKVGHVQKIAEICAFAKKELGFDYLVDITSLDHYGEDPRFTLVYHLYGYSHLRYLRLKADLGEEAGEAPTV